MAQENKYRDADKNMYSIPQPTMPETCQYVSIGLNDDMSAKEEISITQAYPIWFIGYQRYTGPTLINNSGIALLILCMSVAKLTTGTFPDDLNEYESFSSGPNTDYARTAMMILKPSESVAVEDVCNFSNAELADSLFLFYSRPLMA